MIDDETGKPKDNSYYPTLKVLKIVRIYKIIRLVIIIFTSSFFLGILWYIYVIDIETVNYKNDNDHTLGLSESNFYFDYLVSSEKVEIQNMTEEEEMVTLVKLIYFAITTLSTIGYGDLHPVSV